MIFKIAGTAEILECSVCKRTSFNIIRNNKTDSITLICGHCGDDSMTFGAGVTINQAIFIINNCGGI